MFQPQITNCLQFPAPMLNSLHSCPLTQTQPDAHMKKKDFFFLSQQSVKEGGRRLILLKETGTVAQSSLNIQSYSPTLVHQNSPTFQSAFAFLFFNAFFRPLKSRNSPSAAPVPVLSGGNPDTHSVAGESTHSWRTSVRECASV